MLPMYCTFYEIDARALFPSASVALDNATIHMNSTDAAVQFGSGWTPLRNHAGLMTQQNDAKVTLSVRLRFNLRSDPWDSIHVKLLIDFPCSRTAQLDVHDPKNHWYPASPYELPNPSCGTERSVWSNNGQRLHTTEEGSHNLTGAEPCHALRSNPRKY